MSSINRSGLYGRLYRNMRLSYPVMPMLDGRVILTKSLDSVDLSDYKVLSGDHEVQADGYWDVTSGTVPTGKQWRIVAVEIGKLDGTFDLVGLYKSLAAVHTSLVGASAYGESISYYDVTGPLVVAAGWHLEISAKHWVGDGDVEHTITYLEESA